MLGEKVAELEMKLGLAQPPAILPVASVGEKESGSTVEGSSSDEEEGL